MASDSTGIARETLCQLAEVERAKHLRWGQRGLLELKARYGEIDLVRAALLDQMRIALGPSAAAIAWQQVEQELGLPGKQLEMIFDPATHEASLARTDRELLRLLPRGTRVVVVPLHERVARARDRYRAYLARTQLTSTARQSGPRSTDVQTQSQ